MKPYVSVVMAAYNAEKFIAEAIESILQQSFEDFEFIIIEDGSDDATKEIIDSYQVEDNRIKVLQNSSNKGLTYSLNRGLDQAKGTYIARMDADDESLSNRLEVQVSFMDSHQDVGVSSAWMETFGDGKKKVWKSPQEHEKIMAVMFCNNCMWHPVAMIRKSTLDEFNLRYDPNYPKAEDYKLWLEIAEHTRLANIPEILHRYRIHGRQKTQVDSDQRRITKKSLAYIKELPGIRAKMLKDFLSREPTLDELELHKKLFFEIPFTSKKELDELEDWIDFLISVNKKKRKYLEPTFSNSMRASFVNSKRKSFIYFCNQRKRFSPGIIAKLFFSKSKYYQNFSLYQLAAISLNSLIFRKNRNYSVD